MGAEVRRRAAEMLERAKAQSLVGITRDKEVVDLMMAFAAEEAERALAEAQWAKE